MYTDVPYIREADTGTQTEGNMILLTTPTQQITPNMPRLFAHAVTYQVCTYVHIPTHGCV